MGNFIRHTAKLIIVWAIFFLVYYILGGTFPQDPYLHIAMVMNFIGLSVAMEIIGSNEGFENGFENGFAAGAEAYRQNVVDMLEKLKKKWGLK